MEANPMDDTVFQSTLPARGATTTGKLFEQSFIISIHTPREGSDLSGSLTWNQALIFQSTLPARGATGKSIFRND